MKITLKEDAPEEVEIKHFELDSDKIKSIEDIKEILLFLAPLFSVKDESQLFKIRNLIKQI